MNTQNFKRLIGSIVMATIILSTISTNTIIFAEEKLISFKASEGFSDKQGQNNWSYQHTPFNKNDFKDTMEKANTNIKSLLAGMLTELPSNGKIYVGTVTPVTDGSISKFAWGKNILFWTDETKTATELKDFNAMIDEFNLELAKIVSDYSKVGKPVYGFVNYHDDMTVSDIEDDVHPNMLGYKKMADKWFKAIKNDIISLK